MGAAGLVGPRAKGPVCAGPAGARTAETAIEDPWVIAARVFEPCYVGGWSAAEYWGLTEQIFRTVVIITTRKVSGRRPKIQATEFWIKKVAKSRFFGTKTVWRGRVPVQVSDTTKTVVDLLDDPGTGGGIRTVENILRAYLASSEKDLNRLLEYSRRMKNGAIIKRLGYLLDRSGFSDSSILSSLRNSLTLGHSKLDPTLPCDKLVTRWRLWVPTNWVMKKHD